MCPGSVSYTHLCAIWDFCQCGFRGVVLADFRLGHELGLLVCMFFSLFRAATGEQSSRQCGADQGFNFHNHFLFVFNLFIRRFANAVIQPNQHEHRLNSK